MKRILTLITFLIIIMTSTGFAQDENIYESYYFSIILPKDWKQELTPREYMLVAAFPPDIHGGIGIMMVPNQTTSPIDFDNLSNNMPLVEKFKRSKLSLNLEDMHQSAVAGQKALSMKFKSEKEFYYIYTFCKNNNQYIITMSGKLKNSEEDLKLFEETIATFTFVQ